MEAHNPSTLRLLRWMLVSAVLVPAALFAYLASDDAAFATGHVFTMDGGETAGGLASR